MIGFKNAENDLLVFERIYLKEIACKLDYKKTDSAIKWLNERSVTIHINGKKKFVYLVDFLAATMLEKAKEIIGKYPREWEERLRMLVSEINVYNKILEMLEVKSVFVKPSTRVVPKNDKQQELLKKLL